jgi:hypothetical protein
MRKQDLAIWEGLNFRMSGTRDFRQSRRRSRFPLRERQLAQVNASWCSRSKTMNASCVSSGLRVRISPISLGKLAAPVASIRQSSPRGAKSGGKLVRCGRLISSLGARQRTTRNLAAKRAAGVLPKQLGQLLAHAICHAAFGWLHGTAITTGEKLFDRRGARRFALACRGKPCQLSNRLGALLLGQLLDLGGNLVGAALLATRAGPSIATVRPWRLPSPSC